MSKSTKKCSPFYKILKKNKPFRWGEDCKNAFVELKEYISSLPILTKPKDGETLFLYIATFNKAIRIVLIVEWDGEQRPVYFISKVLHGVEIRI